ncbi:disease resistance protein RUN1-like [Eucalyptus grandis]|uniref:disease resistance protein RUN1-like n=1 Tax=Eucalyptus grandis TaxID=71139 RepID=UPI00192EA352|nr:disease resistance protein RUN1-like [Eucalyptus grandis]
MVSNANETFRLDRHAEIYGVGCRQLEVTSYGIRELQDFGSLKSIKTREENVPKLPQSLGASRLKVLDLSNCRKLKETPKLSAFLLLEKLILKGCQMLTKLSDSIGMLKYLVELDVSNTNIVELPNSIVNLKSLKVLNINGSCMQKLPDAIEKMEKLEEIYGVGCRQLEVTSYGIRELQDFGSLKSIKTREENVPKLPQSLVSLHLHSHVSGKRFGDLQFSEFKKSEIMCSHNIVDVIVYESSVGYNMSIYYSMPG